MLGSEEEPERKAQSGMSKAEQRKSNKPIMEKRRRARINQYLDELKNFILVNEKDPTRHSKLEKADILEMTVKRIQTMQQQQLNVAIAGDPGVLTKFRSGFSECATEVSRFVNSLENVEPAVKQRLVSHLNKCVSHLQQMAPFCSYYVPYMPERLYPEVKVGFQSDLQNGDENNNGSARIQIPNGVHLIPSLPTRLPTGELALLVPQSASISTNFSFFPPGTESSTRIGQSSAFTAVHKSRNSPCSPAGSSSSCDDESHHLEHPQAMSSPNPHQPHSSQGKLNVLPSPASSKSLTSSPETQKSQISSSSDRKSPAPEFPGSKPIGNTDQVAKKESQGVNYARKFTEEFMNNVRQPLSVITDRTSNRSWSPVQPKATVSPMKREVDGLLAISDKRPRYQEPTSSSTSSMNNDDALKSASEQSTSIDDPAARQMTPLLRNALSLNIFQRNQEEPFNSNMWRPW